MPLKSCFLGCGKSAESVFRPAMLLLALACLVRPASAQSGDAAAKKYQEQQKHLVQDIRAINNSLLTEELKGREADEETGVPGDPGDFGRAERTYRTVIRNGINRATGPEFEALKTGLTYRVFALTDPEIQANFRQLDSAFGDLVRDLSAARSIPNAQDQKQFRQMVYGLALPLVEQVINEGNLVARSLAIEVLPEMEVLGAGVGNQRRLEMFDEVDEALIRVLSDDKQPDAIKLRAASAAKRFIEKADPVPQDQLALAAPILASLKNPLSAWEYQYALIETLTRVTVPREVVGVKKASILETLVDVMQDSRRDIVVRCAAAGAIGKIGFDGQVNFEPLAWATAKLAVESAVTIGQEKPSARRELCGWHLYLAFHHETADGRNDRRNPQGMLNRAPNSEYVRAAYDHVLPISKALMFAKGGVGNNEMLKASSWVKSNLPASMVFDAASPPLKQ